VENGRLTPERLAYGGAVLEINSPFTLVDDTATTSEDSASITIDVLANDNNAGNGSLTLTEVGTPGNGGTASISNGQVVYTPAADFNGTDTFTYTVRNTSGSAQTANVTVTVTAVNDPPVGTPDTFSVNGDSATTLDLLANDSSGPETGETLTISAVSASTAGGTIEIIDNGTNVRYTPPANFSGNDTFTYDLSDGTDVTTGVQVTLAVDSTNPPPTAVNDAFTVVEDAAEAEFDVLANDSNNDPVNTGETFGLDSVGTSSNGSTVRLNSTGDRIVYAPAADFFGTETITYTIRDSNGASADATITFTVTGVNDPPPADDVAQSVTSNTTDNVVLTLSDIGDNLDGGETVTIQTLGTPSNGGSARIDNNQVLYTPATDFDGTETISYTVRDADGAESTGTITITVSDFTPRDISVSVNGGLAGAARFDVQLAGTSDFNEQISRTATVAQDTRQATFGDLPPGNYRITIPAMPFLIGGDQPDEITVESTADESNETVEASLGALHPRFISLQDFLGSTKQNAVLAAVRPGEASTFLAQSVESEGVTDPDVTLNDAGNEVTVRATVDVESGTDGNTTTTPTLQEVALTLDSADVENRGSAGDFRVLRINVDPSEVPFANTPDSGSTGTSGESTALETSGENPATLETAAEENATDPIATPQVPDAQPQDSNADETDADEIEGAGDPLPAPPESLPTFSRRRLFSSGS
ncbi:MAG: Ig-like domain-containing protein, partial [Planctomycetota bacterium]